MNRFDILLGKPPDFDTRKLKGPYKKGSTGVKPPDSTCDAIREVVHQKMVDNYSVSTADFEALNRLGENLGLRRHEGEFDDPYRGRIVSRITYQ